MKIKHPVHSMGSKRSMVNSKSKRLELLHKSIMEHVIKDLTYTDLTMLSATGGAIQAACKGMFEDKTLCLNFLKERYNFKPISTLASDKGLLIPKLAYWLPRMEMEVIKILDKNSDKFSQREHRLLVSTACLVLCGEKPDNMPKNQYNKLNTALNQLTSQYRKDDLNLLVDFLKKDATLLSASYDCRSPLIKWTEKVKNQFETPGLMALAYLNFLRGNFRPF